MPFKELTLVMLRDRPQRRILLGMKKRGFGAGRWNGFGGKVEAGETVEAAAQRELVEEAGVTSPDLIKCGRLFFEFVGDPVVLSVHVFRGSTWEGTPSESDEMRPQWFPVDDVPFDDMWLDDRHWFPFLLNDVPFSGYMEFEGQTRILRMSLQPTISDDHASLAKAMQPYEEAQETIRNALQQHLSSVNQSD